MQAVVVEITDVFGFFVDGVEALVLAGDVEQGFLGVGDEVGR